MRIPALTVFMGLAVMTASATASGNGWTRVDAPDVFYDSKGVLRQPACALDSPPGIGPGSSYAFFFRPGEPDRLAIFWDGGGACWDANTCIGSVLAGNSVYSLSVDETVESLNTAAGIGDLSNPDNPVAGYTQVFIPYCTGDLHTGAKDNLYTLTLADGSEVPWLIRHRGFDNVAFVLDWLTDYYGTEVGHPPRDVFLAGASAGGYGVLYAYPAVAERLPWYARVRTLVDAANGVITQDFYDRALTPNGVWGAWGNLAPELTGAFASGPDEVVIRIFQSLGSAYPRARFGQYTTAFDATQIFFFNAARNTDSPELWLDPGELAISALEWTVRARGYMALTALTTWNYRYYLAQGEDHTVIADDKFYTESSAGGVALVDWVDDMINRWWPWGSDWRNVTCTPNCLP